MEEILRLEDIAIRMHLVPGDLGYVIHRHGALYHEENDFGVSFEAYVAAGVSEFYQGYDPGKDCVWVCEHRGKIIGFMLCMHRPDNAAQLRYFFIDRTYRGLGLGKKLMELFMEFIRTRSYTTCYLWTTHEQQTAVGLYRRHGFNLAAEKESVAFGKSLIEQRYELVL